RIGVERHHSCAKSKTKGRGGEEKDAEGNVMGAEQQRACRQQRHRKHVAGKSRQQDSAQTEAPRESWGKRRCGDGEHHLRYEHRSVARAVETEAVGAGEDRARGRKGDERQALHDCAAIDDADLGLACHRGCPPRLFFLCTSVWSSPPTRGPTLTGRCSWVPACARTTNLCGSSRALGPILPLMAPTRGDEAGQVLVLPRVLNACPRWRGTCPRRACGERAQDWCRELIRVRGTRSKAAPHPTPLPAPLRSAGRGRRAVRTGYAPGGVRAPVSSCCRHRRRRRRPFS